MGPSRQRFENESKRRKFERLAETRTAAVTEAIRIFGNLSNPYVYESGEGDVLRFAQAVLSELDATCRKFDVDIATFGIAADLGIGGDEESEGGEAE